MNGVADSAQKSKVALSVASLANQAGIPRLLVDLRHESTHNELPSLSVLRIAAKQALQWLEGRYWEAQREHLRVCTRRLDGIVTNYINSHFMAAAKEAASNRKSSKEKMDDEQLALDGSEYDVKQWKKYRQSLLTELRTLVPKGGMTLLVRSLLHCDFASHSTNQEEGISSEVMRLACSRGLKQIAQEWTGISLLVLQEIIGDLFEHLLIGKELGRETDVWFAVCLHAVELKCIKNLISGFIKTYSSRLKKKKIKWYVQAIEKSDLEALSRLSSSLQQLSSQTPDAQSRKACDQFIQTYLTVSRDDISKELQIWNSDKGKRKLEEIEPNVQGHPGENRRTTWTIANTWQPCAIGLCPSLTNPNGTFPDIHHVMQDGGEKHREMLQPKSMMNQTTNETTKHNLFELTPSRRSIFIPTEGAKHPNLENENDASSNSLSSLDAPQSMPSDGDTESEPTSSVCHERQGTCLPPPRLLE